MLALSAIQATVRGLIAAHDYFDQGDSEFAVPVYADDGTAHAQVEASLRAPPGCAVVVFPPLGSSLISQVPRITRADVDVIARVLINPEANRTANGGRGLDPMAAVSAILEAVVGAYSPENGERSEQAFRAGGTPFEIVPSDVGLLVYDVNLSKPTVL